MDAQTLLKQIEEFCRRTGTAETTFGNRAVNDGKLVSRLRGGGSVTLPVYWKIVRALETDSETDAA